MLFEFEERPAESSLVDQIWCARSIRSGVMNSTASTHCELVVTHRDGRSFCTIRGPQTFSTALPCEADGEWIGIRLKPGAFMPRFSPAMLLNNDCHLPNAVERSFWLDGSAWEFPTFENADTFVAHLIRRGLIECDPYVLAALHGEAHGLSPRSMQRRFLRATGLTQNTIHQIARARAALERLQQGALILDVVHELGFYDQSHLTRSLKRWLGETPGEIAGSSRFDAVSL
jgi:AraC-like DNA-binding protein